MKKQDRSKEETPSLRRTGTTSTDVSLNHDASVAGSVQHDISDPNPSELRVDDAAGTTTCDSASVARDVKRRNLTSISRTYVSLVGFRDTNQDIADHRLVHPCGLAIEAAHV
jgi:hypothetical protein